MSWTTAFNDLQDGLTAARVIAGPGNPVEVWVAEGVYRPSSSDRAVAFELADHVEILGGFAGNETMASQRDPELRPTILSGDLQGNDPVPLVNQHDPRAADNAYQVIRASGVDETAVIDGFVITAGVANGAVLQDIRGAGLLVGSGASPTVRRCQFKWNLARAEGAGVCILEGASATVEQCVFEGNFAGTGGGLAVIAQASVVAREVEFIFNFSAGSGGAVALGDATTAEFIDCRFASNEGDSIVQNVGDASEYTGCSFELNLGTALRVRTQLGSTISGCQFRSNTGRAIEIGGGMTEVLDSLFERNSSAGPGGAIESSASGTIARCVFRMNSSGDSGGAVFWDGFGAVLIDECVFEGNSAASSGGALNFNDGTVSGCEFTGNEATNGGGLRGTSLIVEGCTFTGNSAELLGGGASLGAESELISCEFSGNEAASGGGAHVTRCVVTGCQFTGNSASVAGGGLLTRHLSQPRGATIRGCAFVENVAPLGGGVRLDGTDAIIELSEFLRNQAAQDGGAVSSVLGEPSVTGSVFDRNVAESRGGGVHLAQNSDITLIGCLFTGNEGHDGGAIFATEFSDVTLTGTTLVANAAAAAAGGVYIEDSGALRSRNTILWGNADASGMSEMSQVTVVAPASGDVGYSAVESWTGSLGGTGNHGDDPGFVDELGPDLLPGTGDENLRLTSGSPCVDSGSNPAVPAGIDADLDGLPRFVDDPATPDTGIGPSPIVDMGAYELQLDNCYADCDRSTGTGVLDIFDFICFQDAFAALDPYACDCDIGTGPGLCDIFDFVCFQDEFVRGCP